MTLDTPEESHMHKILSAVNTILYYTRELQQGLRFPSEKNKKREEERQRALKKAVKYLKKERKKKKSHNPTSWSSGPYNQAPEKEFLDAAIKLLENAMGGKPK